MDSSHSNDDDKPENENFKRKQKTSPNISRKKRLKTDVGKMENLPSASSQEMEEASMDPTPSCGADCTEDNDSDSETDEPHGMIRPTLLKQLQVILDEYPDDAQIIRELVQNAEDAGASEMRIFHDKRHTVVPENNDFARYFRAPALCVYNDAKFTQQDWEGIVTLYDSNKQSDALKVGRFGLGFKSVFHMTDHPVIISDDRLLIIDPCKGEKECIPKKFRHIDSSVTSALEPILGKFGFTLECIRKRSYKGTLFWFPLREQKSDLSGNLYSNEKMESLITLFINETSVTLLFLRNMKQMFIHTENDKESHISVQHILEDEYSDCLQQFHANIRSFQGTLPVENRSCFLRSEMKVMQEHEVISTEKWAISCLYKGKAGMSSVLETLTADESLSYCPLVGIAVLTSSSTKVNQSKPWVGHVFCFLPLPLQSESLTGLPVHLNGFFSLSQNRRHVKWPSSDNEAHNDKMIQWNQRLCEEVLVDAYVNVVDSLKEITIQDGKTDPSENLVYKALPQIDLVHSNWSIILDPLYKELFGKDTFYTENDNGKWIPMSESIFSIFDWTPPNQNSAKIVEDDVLEILSIYNKNVVQVPDHVKYALLKYHPNFQKICPGFVRQILKTDDCYKQVSNRKRMHLLEFVMSDVEANTSDLENLELLPLKNGAFTTFSNNSKAQPIYLCTEKEYVMFPKLEYKFADFEVSLEWYERIHHLVTQGFFQLKPFASEFFPELLKEMLELNSDMDPSGAFVTPSSEIISSALLPKIWEYLNINFESLKDFELLHIIPVEGGHGQKLFRLQGFYVLKAAPGMKTLTSGVQEALSAMSITIIDNMSEAIVHPKLRGTHCKFPTVSNLLGLLREIYIQHNFAGHGNHLYEFTKKFNESCSIITKDEFRKYISEESVSLSLESKEILKELKLFPEKLNDERDETLVSVTENRYIACKEPFPFPFPKPYLVLDNTLTSELAQQLGAVQTTWKDVVIETLICIIQKRSDYYTATLIQKFMTYFIHEISAFQQETNSKALILAKQISFVTTASGQVLRPDELFDPEDDCLKDLFAVLPECFPSEEFRKQHILNGLKLLGLKNRSNISHDDITMVAKSVHSLQTESSKMKEIKRSAVRLLAFLKEDSNRVIQPSLLSSLGSFRWVPYMNIKPSNYPDILPWFGSCTSERLCFPQEARNLDFISVAGSAMYLVDVDKTSNIGNAFNWNKPPSMERVIEQIKIIITKYSKDVELDLLRILKSVYIHFNNSDWNQLKTMLKDIPFVFNQCGFCHSSDVFINFPDNLDEFDMKPFMYRLPEEFRGMQNMFTFFGCHKTLDSTILIDVLRKVNNKHQGKIAKKEVIRDRKLAISILQTLTETFSGDYDCSQVLVPVSGDPSMLIMKPAVECTYDDYSQKNNDFTVDEDEDFKVDIYVHPDISASLAVSLGIPSLTKRFMTDNDATEMIADWGQSEPLTTRLSNLLEGYSDGFSILKELVQNAEDAGASEICFMYDERNNESLKSKVIENMAECQGPAFWAFNNAVFEEDDFENIIKLGGRTKEKDRHKIGKFGLGFCSVYNLTDVPSFISKNTMVILDPHTQYLGRAISNKSNPGIRINFKTRSILNRYRNQFEPYDNVFGCKLSTEHFPPDFQGTLFRFPLRTKKQAAVSDIKKLHYNKQEVLKLLQIFESSVGDLLLFTQNLKRVSLWHLKEDAMDPTSATLILNANKNTVDTIPHDLSSFSAIKQAGLLLQEENEIVSENFKMIQQFSVAVTQFRNSIMHEDYETNMESQTNWLVSWSSGGQAAIEKAVTLKEKGALPLGSVALPLSLMNGNVFPKSISSLPSNFCQLSLIFCFLPLPEISSVPVHINGCFAIESDRKRICRATGDDKSSDDSDWNITLLTVAICDSYLHMLEHLNKSKDYSTFWPQKRKHDIPELTEAFYQKVVRNNPYVFNNGFKTASFKDCRFLESSLRHDRTLGDIAYTFFLEFYDGPGVAMDMTKDVFRHFSEFGCFEHLEKHTVSILEFYSTLVLPNLEKMKEHTKELNALLIFALEHHESLNVLLTDSNCIPTLQNDLVVFKKPKELVRPKSKVSKLFCEYDGRFPTDAFCSEHILDILIKLGMMHNSLPTDLIIERAQSVEKLSDGDAQLKRCSYILKYLHSQAVGNDELLTQLSSIKFVPVLQKPASWPIHWKADEWLLPDSTKLLQLDEPQNMYLLKSQNLIGSIKNIVDSQNLSYGNADILKQLGVSDNKDIKCQDVVQQLQSIANVADNIHGFESSELIQLRIIADHIYNFIEEQLKDPLSPFECTLLHNLETKHILFLNNKLIRPDKTTLDNENILKCSYVFEPEIYHLYDEMKFKFKNFLQSVGVPLKLEKTDIIKIIARVQKEREGQILSDDQTRLISNLLLLLSDFIRNTCIDKLTENERENILVPDDQSCLRRWHDVCIDDGYTKLRKQDYMHFVNDSITPAVQKMLGIKSKRQTHLSKITGSMPFGQKEELVTRIKNILEMSPLCSSILHEMLQNADDAGASEIAFVLDMRHHDKQYIFDESWESLQGPALCVYNDTCFSAEDLKGIASLGIGSKSDIATKTGQFGIGFNAVYHITDAPSFISRGDATPNGGTFCVFDPNCNYCPIATEDQPGMMISDLEELEKEYPDVYVGYLQTIIPRTCGTWFRLPLRTKDMAGNSKICSKPTTMKDIDKMFTSFKSNMLKSLLYLRNVKKISLSHIAEFNPVKLQSIYEVEADITENDQGKLKDYYTALDSLTSSLKAGQLLDTLPLYDVGYEVTLKDSNSRKEKWIVVQNCGHSSSIKIPENLMEMLKMKEIRLSPRGGVAFKIDDKLDESIPSVNRKVTGMEMVNATKGYNHICVLESGQAFCLLPIHALKTGLPVHINGHFALDPARQYLRKEDSYESPKGLWNKFLTENIIPTAYVKAIEFLRDYLFKTDLPHNSFMSDWTITEREKCYLAAFPSYKKATDPAWKNLVTCVYSTAIQNEVEIFPVTVDHSIKWVAITSQGHSFPAFFDDLCSQFEEDVKHLEINCINIEQVIQQKKRIEKALIEAQSLSSTLKSIGMKLIDFPIYFFDNMKASLENVNQTLCDSDEGRKHNENVRKVSAKDILEFLLTDNTDFPDRCIIKNMGENIEVTNFECITSVQILLKFCIRHEKEILSTNLKKLPLLVTNDGKLHRFENVSPLFLSPFCDLLLGSKELFVHSSLVYILQSVQMECTYVLRSMEISNFAELLPRSMDECRLRSHESLVWDQRDHSLPNEQWICRLWNYLDSLRNTDPGSIVNTLKDWCFVPSTDQINACNLLIPLKLSHIVIDCRSFEYCEEMEAFMSLRLPKPMQSCSEINKLQMVIASSKRPDSILRCLHFHRHCLEKNKGHIKNKVTILNFLNKKFDDLSDVQYLFSLPLYKTVTGSCTAIDKRMKIRRVKESHCLVKEGLNEWADKSDYILLYDNTLLEKILSCVSGDSVTITSFYKNDLLQDFKMLDPSCHLEHLEYIRENLIFQEPDFSNVLQGIEFIPNHNQLESARHYFNPNIPLFKSMQTFVKFPPHPFHQKCWIEFMLSAGMQNKVTVPMYIGFAKELEKRLLQHGLCADLRKQSEKMVAHLFNRDGIFQEELLQKIRDIRFLLPHIVEDFDRSVCPQNNIDNPICFSGSAVYSVRRLVWTTMSILPKYADPLLSLPNNESEKAKKFHEKLNISFNPPIKTVVSHVHNVCNALNKICQEHNLNPQQKSACVDDISKLMKDIYGYLLEHGLNDEAKLGLSETPFVHIRMKENMHFFVKADQTTVNLQPEDEILPYLFKMPIEYGNFHELFEFYGTTETVAIYQYLKVLKCLYTEQTRTEGLLAPDEVMKAKKAYTGFLKLLTENEEDKITKDLKDLTDMHLLSDSKNRQNLMKSTELIIADNKELKKRLRNTNFCFLAATNQMHVFRKVPEILRPKYLTDIVEIILVSSQNDTVNENAMSEKLQQLLKSKHFLRGIDMFVRKNGPRSTIEETHENVSKVLVGLRVRCLNQIITVLKINGNEVTESQQDSDYFYSKENKMLYLKRNEWDVRGFLRNVKESLCMKLCELTCNKVKQLQMEKLFDYIDDLDGLKEFVNDSTNDSDEDDDDLSPTLGNHVPKALHILLDNNFSELRGGDYVAYELWDPAIDGDDMGEDVIFIYVQVLRNVSTVSDVLCQQYVIDMGSNTEKTVHAIRLYRFLRKPEDFNTDLVLYTDCHQGTTTLNKDRIFEQIHRTLVDAWKQDIQVRKRILKRLLLRWHPDKNQHNEDFCKEVTQFILEQIERLADGTSSRHGTDGSNSQRTARDSPIVTEWSWFTEKMSFRFHQYQQRWHDSRSWWYEHHIHEPNPQPGEAKRWMKQAKMDLKMAKTTIVSAEEAQGYNWVCVLCQQACEKACKAVGINVDSDRVNKRTHHLTQINSRIDILFSESVKEALNRIENLTGYYSRMRYPTSFDFPKIPSELYTEENAKEAVAIASEIVNELENLL